MSSRRRRTERKRVHDRMMRCLLDPGKPPSERGGRGRRREGQHSLAQLHEFKDAEAVGAPVASMGVHVARPELDRTQRHFPPAEQGRLGARGRREEGGRVATVRVCASGGALMVMVGGGGALMVREKSFTDGGCYPPVCRREVEPLHKAAPGEP